MSWPNTNADGSLFPFTTDQLKALELQTKDIRDGSHPTLELDSKGCSIRRQWFSKWQQRDNAIAAFLGAVSLAGTAPNWTLSRVMPQVFPDAGYEQYIALAAESVRGGRSAGKDDSKTIPAYKSAELIMRYEQVFWGLAPDGAVPEYNRYVEQLPSTVETNYLSLPGSMMTYRTSFVIPPSGYLIPYGIGRPEVITKIGYRWHRIPYEAWFPGSPLYLRVHGDPSNTTKNASGKVVGVPYVGTVTSAAFLGYPSGYALFDGVEEEIVPDPVRGYPCWNLTYKFSIKNVLGGSPDFQEQYGGHNYLYYGGAGADANKLGYYFATKSPIWLANGAIPDGVCLFNERNLLNLFSVGAVADANI